MPHLGGYRRTHFFAVCDGHGDDGHLVSEFVKNKLAENVAIGIKHVFDCAKSQNKVIDTSQLKS